MIQTCNPASLSGTVSAPASKSHAHRLLICAALADRPTEIRCNGFSRDLAATVSCLQALGTSVSYKNNQFLIQPSVPVPSGLLPCGESGSTLRFLLPVAAALGVPVTFSMEGRLSDRPMAPLEEQLACHGVTLSRPQPNLLNCNGKLRPGHYILPGNVSSQFISGLLMALPLLDSPSTLTVTGKLESAPYVELTLEVLRQFGIKIEADRQTYVVYPSAIRSPGSVTAEGDWSNAAFWLTAGALGRPVTVTGLNPQSLQGDRAIVPLLQKMGAFCHMDDACVTVTPGSLSAVDIDASDIPDLVPILSVAAAAATGTTRIFHAQRLRLKESNRLESICRMLRALGSRAEETADGLLIHGGVPLTGGTVDSCGDHRIAMAAAIASVFSTGPVTVTGAEAVEKSYPSFWEEFYRLQGEVL